MSEKEPQKPSQLSEEEIRELRDSAQQIDPIDLQELAKSSQEKTASRPSRWREIKSIAGRFLRRTARDEVIATVATGPAAPIVDTGVFLYDTYHFGKDLYNFYKKEQSLASTATHLAEKKAFHEIEQQAAKDAAINPTINKYKNFVHGDSLNNLSNNLSQSVSYVLGNPSYEIYHPTLAARISKAGDSFENYEKEVKLITQATERSANLPKNYISGTPEEDYQLALGVAHKNLGGDYFNRVTQPDRILRFEQTTAEWLYKNGHEVSEVNSAVKQNSPYITGLNEVQQEQYLKKISERILQKEPELEKFHQIQADSRLSEKISAGERLTPQELETAKYKAQHAHEMHMRKVVDASMNKLKEYQANPNLKLSTMEEYQVELGRRLQKIEGSKFNFKQQDKEITFQMMLARHKPEEIAKTLNEASFIKEKNYGEQVVEQVMSEMKHDPVVPLFRAEVKRYMDEGSIPANETRLDKLGLHYGVMAPLAIERDKNSENQKVR